MRPHPVLEAGLTLLTLRWTKFLLFWHGAKESILGGAADAYGAGAIRSGWKSRKFLKKNGFWRLTVRFGWIRC
jgi:hypothetical protein